MATLATGAGTEAVMVEEGTDRWPCVRERRMDQVKSPFSSVHIMRACHPSLLLVMLMHASVNNTTGIVPAAVADGITPLAFGGSLVAWVTVALSWLVAIPLLIQMRGINSTAPKGAFLQP